MGIVVSSCKGKSSSAKYIEKPSSSSLNKPFLHNNYTYEDENNEESNTFLNIYQNNNINNSQPKNKTTKSNSKNIRQFYSVENKYKTNANYNNYNNNNPNYHYDPDLKRAYNFLDNNFYDKINYINFLNHQKALRNINNNNYYSIADFPRAQSLNLVNKNNNNQKYIAVSDKHANNNNNKSQLKHTKSCSNSGLIFINNLSLGQNSKNRKKIHKKKRSKVHSKSCSSSSFEERANKNHISDRKEVELANKTLGDHQKRVQEKGKIGSRSLSPIHYKNHNQVNRTLLEVDPHLTHLSLVNLNSTGMSQSNSSSTHLNQQLMHTDNNNNNSNNNNNNNSSSIALPANDKDNQQLLSLHQHHHNQTEQAVSRHYYHHHHHYHHYHNKNKRLNQHNHQHNNNQFDDYLNKENQYEDLTPSPTMSVISISNAVMSNNRSGGGMSGGNIFSSLYNQSKLKFYFLLKYNIL
jgi:hypothetical protein